MGFARCGVQKRNGYLSEDKLWMRLDFSRIIQHDVLYDSIF